MRYLFSHAFWGRSHADRFLDYCLPSMLGAGNLAAVPNLSNSLFQIVTTQADWAYIDEAPAIVALRELIEVEFTDIDAYLTEDSRENKYFRMSEAQIAALDRVGEFDAIFFGYADFIWSAGALGNAARRLEQGYDAVFCPGLRAEESNLLAALRKNRNHWTLDMASTALSLTVPPRDLAAASLANLHSHARANFVDAKLRSLTPAFQVWPVPTQGVLMRWFHLHPVVIRTFIDNQKIPGSFSGSLDADYVPAVFDSTEKLYLASDSDEISFVSLSPAYFEPPTQQPRTLRSIAAWAENYADLIHREFFDNAYRFHYADMDPDLWARAEQASAKFASSLRMRMLTPDSVLAASDSEAVFFREQKTGASLSAAPPPPPPAPEPAPEASPVAEGAANRSRFTRILAAAVKEALR